VKKVSAYGCTRRAGDQSGGLSTAVCLVLDPTHAQHTMRVFQRDQRPGGVVHALTEGEADRLLALDAPARQVVADDAETLAAAS
jgi:hypothetical protein